MSKNFKIIYISAIVLLLMAVTALVVIETAEFSRGNLPVLGTVPEFTFTERSGVPFGSREMLGKINIVNFFFTSCRGPCPVMNRKVAELYTKYASTDAVRFVSISVDPARDSLKVLQAYANEYGVTDDRWLFLRGEMEEVHRVSEEGFMLAGDLPSVHSTKLILVDDQNRIRGYYDSFSDAQLELLTVHVRELLTP